MAADRDGLPPMTAPPAGALEASRESRMAVLERDASGTPTIWCDPEIVDLVRALNTGDLRTVASCSGHGEQHGNIALKDGRELLIAPDYDTARQMERALLAALRLREGVRQARMDLRLMACDLKLLRPNEPLSVVGRKHYAERINATADDLARVLENER